MLIGLVGKPSVGKSTFFKAATLAEVAIAPHPFTTIKPNHGVGYVKIDCIDREFNVQCTPKHGFCINGKRFVPVQLMDVAGLVPGASEGKGLGNKFLDDLREADAFIHIVDISGTTDYEGKTVPYGKIHDPLEDARFLEDELNKWYHGIFMKAWKSFSKNPEMRSKGSFSKLVAKQFSGLKINEDEVKDVLSKGVFKENPSTWTNEDLMRFSSQLRVISKPMIIAANKMDRPKSEGNFDRMKNDFDYPIVPCSAEYELVLRQADKNKLVRYVPGDKSFEIIGEINDNQRKVLEDVKDFLGEHETGTGVQDILNKVVFELLKMVAIFPAGDKLEDSNGNVLPDCYLMPHGSTALDFAFKLHSDIGRGFVKAIDVRTKRAVGKEYLIKNRDGLEIITR